MHHPAYSYGSSVTPATQNAPLAPRTLEAQQPLAAPSHAPQTYERTASPTPHFTPNPSPSNLPSSTSSERSDSFHPSVSSQPPPPYYAPPCSPHSSQHSYASSQAWPVFGGQPATHTGHSALPTPHPSYSAPPVPMQITATSLNATPSAPVQLRHPTGPSFSHHPMFPTAPPVHHPPHHPSMSMGQHPAYHPYHAHLTVPGATLPHHPHWGNVTSHVPHGPALVSTAPPPPFAPYGAAITADGSGGHRTPAPLYSGTSWGPSWPTAFPSLGVPQPASVPIPTVPTTPSTMAGHHTARYEVPTTAPSSAHAHVRPTPHPHPLAPVWHASTERPPVAAFNQLAMDERAVNVDPRPESPPALHSTEHFKHLASLNNPADPLQPFATLGCAKGHLGELSKDRMGAHHLSHIIAVANDSAIGEISAVLLGVELIPTVTSEFGHEAVLKLLDRLPPDALRGLTGAFVGKVHQLAHNAYSHRILGRLLSLCDDNARHLLMEELHPTAEESWDCLTNPYASHVLQQCVKMSPQRCDFITDAVLKDAVRFACDQHGSSVVRTIVSTPSAPRRNELVRGLAPSVDMLAVHPHGNYVAQQLIEASLGEDPADVRGQLIRTIQQHFIQYSYSKYASNVVERAYECMTEAEQTAVLEQMMQPAVGSHHPQRSHVYIMMESHYANYVVQDMVYHTKHRRLLERLCEHLTPYTGELSVSAFGRRALITMTTVLEKLRNSEV